MLNNVEKCHWTIQHVSLGHIDFNIVFYIIYSICQQILAHFCCMIYILKFQIYKCKQFKKRQIVTDVAGLILWKVPVNNYFGLCHSFLFHWFYALVYSRYEYIGHTFFCLEFALWMYLEDDWKLACRGAEMS